MSTSGSKKKINRRDFIRSAAKSLAAAGITTSFFLHSRCSNSKYDIRTGYLPITDAAALLIAHALGFFAEEGIRMEKPVLIRSWSTLVESFISDKINLTHLLLPIPIWMRYSKKIPVKIIAWAHTNGSAITINSNSDIKSISDLGQKTIAVPYWYSMHNVVLQLALKKFNLKPVIRPVNMKIGKTEVNLLILPPSEMPAALLSNKIDGYIVAEPFNAIGEEKINARILRFTGDMWKDHPCCTVVVKEKLINNDPVLTQKITNAIVRAEEWLLGNKFEAANILHKNGQNYLPVSRNILYRAFDGYEVEKYGRGNIPQAIKHPEWNIERIGFQPYPFPSATRFIYNKLKETVVEGNSNFLKKYDTDFVVKDIVVTKFINNSIKNGFGKSFLNYEVNGKLGREEIIDI